MLPEFCLTFAGNEYCLSAYALCAVLAALAGILLVCPGLKNVGLTARQVITLLLIMAVAFLIGARLWNVAVNPLNFANSLHWYSLKLTGLSLYGGIAGAMIVLAALLSLWRKPMWLVLDAFVMPSAIAFAVARVGCFCAGCCAGRVTTSWLGVVFPAKQGYQQAVAELLPFITMERAVIPTQLFELSLALLGLPLTYWLARRFHLPSGCRFLIYGIWFCTMRLAVFPFRALAYSQIITHFVYPLLYIGLIVVGLLLLWRKIGIRK